MGTDNLGFLQQTAGAAHRYTGSVFCTGCNLNLMGGVGMFTGRLVHSGRNDRKVFFHQGKRSRIGLQGGGICGVVVFIGGKQAICIIAYADITHPCFIVNGAVKQVIAIGCGGIAGTDGCGFSDSEAAVNIAGNLRQFIVFRRYGTIDIEGIRFHMAIGVCGSG